jgi:hypothetical protein
MIGVDPELTMIAICWDNMTLKIHYSETVNMNL